MVIDGSLSTDAPAQGQTNATSSHTSDGDGADFSALLFLMLAPPQVQGFLLPGKSQLGGEGDDPVSLSLEEGVDTIPFFPLATGARTAEYSPTLSRAEGPPDSATALTLESQSGTNLTPIGLAGQEGNADNKDATVPFQEQEVLGTFYTTHAGALSQRVTATETDVGNGITKKSGLTPRDGSVLISAPFAHEAVQIPSLDAQPDDSVGIEISHSDRVNGKHIAPDSDWQPLAIRDRDPIIFIGNGEKDLSSDTKGNQNHSAQVLDLSSSLAPAVRRFEEGVKAGGSRASGIWSPVINRVAGEIVAGVRQNKHEAVITLEPPELGHIKIGLSLEGDKVQAHILAETHESGRLIENHLSELKQALQLQSLDLVDIRVESGSWNGVGSNYAESFRNFNRQQQWRDGSESSFSPGMTGETGEPQIFRSSYSVADG